MTTERSTLAVPHERKVVLYRNGSVYTAADPFATAMLVDGDTVAWVGSEQAASSIADSSMEIIDLHGALAAPGFVDSHVHLTETGIALASLQLGGIRSARQLLDAVAAAKGDGPCWVTAGMNPRGRTRPFRRPRSLIRRPVAGRCSSPGWMRIRRWSLPPWLRPPGLADWTATARVHK
ncbi:dihydroorotase [Arthrobacter sp. Hiyo4]|nr:dihydroorotase [Arthrobacter sp. Hiyo4]